MNQRQIFSAYPPGSRIEIAGRVFERIATGSFWREELEHGAGRVTELPSVTLRALEEANGHRHKLLPKRTLNGCG